MSDSSGRPNPLAHVASSVGTAWAAASGIVGALVAFGVLTSVQGDAIATVGAVAPTTITAVGTLIAGVTTMAAGLIGAFRTATAGKDHVTPVSSPMGLDSLGRLVPLVPVTDHHREMS